LGLGCVLEFLVIPVAAMGILAIGTVLLSRVVVEAVQYLPVSGLAAVTIVVFGYRLLATRLVWRQR
jgi:hypothetical protein